MSKRMYNRTHIIPRHEGGQKYCPNEKELLRAIFLLSCHFSHDTLGFTVEERVQFGIREREYRF